MSHVTVWVTHSASHRHLWKRLTPVVQGTNLWMLPGSLLALHPLVKILDSLLCSHDFGHHAMLLKCCVTAQITAAKETRFWSAYANSYLIKIEQLEILVSNPINALSKMSLQSSNNNNSSGNKCHIWKFHVDWVHKELPIWILIRKLTEAVHKWL